MYDLMSECNVLKDWNEDVKANGNQIVDSKVCFQNLMIRIERTSSCSILPLAPKTSSKATAVSMSPVIP
jgi:hypothetical protein